VAVKPPNGPRISRREASAASEAVGLMRVLASPLLGQQPYVT